MADFGFNDKIDVPTYLLKIPHYILYLVDGGVLISWILSPRVKDKQRINILFNYFSLVDVSGCEVFEIVLFINYLLFLFPRKGFGLF
jgi:hypothetical protein